MEHKAKERVKDYWNPSSQEVLESVSVITHQLMGAGDFVEAINEIYCTYAEGFITMGDAATYNNERAIEHLYLLRVLSENVSKAIKGEGKAAS